MQPRSCIGIHAQYRALSEHLIGLESGNIVPGVFTPVLAKRPEVTAWGKSPLKKKGRGRHLTPEA